MTGGQFGVLKTNGSNYNIQNNINTIPEALTKYIEHWSNIGQINRILWDTRV